MDKFAAQALEEYCSNDKTVRRTPFWNIHSMQFMYAPAFSFSKLYGAKEYIFTATDCNGKEHTFTSDTPEAPLTPIWKELPCGFVKVQVEAVYERTCERFVMGARTFYKLEPFPGRADLPKKARSYSECARKAFEYAFNDSILQYWLKYGVPQPDYYHNVYPSKMISSIIRAMISYAKLEPEKASDALKIATNSADYLISITYGEDSGLAGLPPTYSFDGLIKEIVDANAPNADKRKDLLMTIYPAQVGLTYLELERATKDKKYFDAAEKIAQYYRDNVLENGSWYLLVEHKTGKPVSENCCASFGLLEFLHAFYERTKQECYNTLERNYFAYLQKHYLENYNWEGQFEDSALSSNYSNLTHFEADRMIQYIAKNYSDDAEMMNTAKELMRFVEDQFVVWGKFAPWNEFLKGDDVWFSPAGVEQYGWYVPIDGSTSFIAQTFLALYKATGDELCLEKACALADSVTRMQNAESGVIPTHWMTADCSENIEFFWINCHIGTAFSMMLLAEETEK